MSHIGSKNLIVGDVKQSIYRWRSGDWRLLNAIDTEFPHSTEIMDIRPLKTNYRSERRIIDFNNVFFTEAVHQEYDNQRDDNPQGAEQLRRAYADVTQEVPEKRDVQGMVNVCLLPQDDYQNEVLNKLTDTIDMLLSKGIKAKDIAILVRSNHNIPMVAEHFAEHMPQVRIVSDEATLVCASLLS